MKNKQRRSMSCLSNNNRRRPEHTKLKVSHLAIAVSFLMSLSHHFAQAQNSGDSEWIFAKEIQNVKLSYASKECNGNKFIFLKFENGNEKAIQGVWNMKVKIGDNTLSFKGIVVNLDGKATENGSCERMQPYLVVPLPPDLSWPAVVTSLEANITTP